MLYRSIERTADGMGERRSAMASVFAPMVARFDDLFADASQPVLRVPRHPLTLARFGTARDAAGHHAGSAVEDGARPGRSGPGSPRTPSHRLDRPMTSAVGLMLIVAAHAKGWVVAKAARRRSPRRWRRHRTPRRQIETGQRVTSPSTCPPSDVLMLDVSPSIAAGILGDRLAEPSRPLRIAGSVTAPAAFKVDFAVEDGVPWTRRRPPSRHGPPRRRSRRDRRQRGGGSPRDDARAAVRARRPAVSRRPDPVGGRHPPAVDVRPRALRLRRRCDRGDHRPDRAFRSRVPGADHRHGGALHDRDVGLQRRTTSAATSSAGRPRRRSSCSDRGSPSTRTSPASPAPICARRRRRRARARTACAAPTPPLARWHGWVLNVRRLVRRISVTRHATTRIRALNQEPRPAVREGVKGRQPRRTRRGRHHAPGHRTRDPSGHPDRLGRATWRSASRHTTSDVVCRDTENSMR